MRRGFPTNITFSEGIGFLTRSTPGDPRGLRDHRHEAAHQWWGNILVPGKGPGGNILSEGTSHFSTILLVEQVKGLNARIDFCKRIEASYARSRQADSERPARQDSTATGRATRPSPTIRAAGSSGCCLNHMGRDRALDGHPVVHQGLSRQSRPPRAPGPPRRDATVRRRSAGLRRLRPAVVLRGRHSRVSALGSPRRPPRDRPGR